MMIREGKGASKLIAPTIANGLALHTKEIDHKPKKADE